MTTLHARSRHHTPARVPARVPAQVSDPYAHLHPDWRPPASWHDPAADFRNPPANPVGAHGCAPAPAGLPVACNATAASPITPPASSVGASGGRPPATPPTTTTTARRYVPGSALPPPDPTGARAEDEDAIFHDPYLHGGSETKLSYTALPLRHRIYALHCQGRSLSSIARTLRLDRGTVARHLHATEDLLLAEQTADLARLRLRAIEAQHAILAAAWDALLCEELNEFDHSNDHPYPSRRAQLLATAARAARTAAQLQGLFTPAALQAALQATAQPIAQPTSTPDVVVGAHGCAPPATPSTTPAPPDDPAAATSAASCGMPASTITPAPSVAEHWCAHVPTGLPVAFNSTAGFPTTPLTPADYPANSIRGIVPTTPPIHDRDGRPFAAAAATAMRAAMRAAVRPTMLQ